MNYRFLTNHFVTNSGIELAYLISRLDGPTYEDVKTLIDNSLISDLSGNSAFVLDAHLSYGPGVGSLREDVIATHDNLEALSMIDTIDLTDSYILNYSGEVIGYSSSGKHAGMPLGYIVNLLELNYAAGAIFNTYESFNGFLIDFNNYYRRQDNQGLISEFIGMGGSGGVCHTYEPAIPSVVKDSIFFPFYSIGYSIVDAAYQSMPYLAWQNVVVGDPLCTIAWGKQTLAQNLTWSGRNLVTGEITIPVPYTTLTIEDDSYIELRHQGSIPCELGYGRLIVGENVAFQTYSWDQALFLSYDSENARLIWADHPTFPAISYNVYRKVDDGDWEYLASTSGNEYTDGEVYFTCYECYVNATVYYYVKAVDLNETESAASNEVSAEVIAKIGKQSGDDKQPVIAYSYSLGQNYPNPFNPSTTISYSIEKDGLVRLKVYDILGNEVAELVNKNQLAGKYEISFNASHLPSGIYFYTITSGNYSNTKKLILLK
ncbi:MAG: T9SS type A sorting domain-containing protein [Ignavibacteriaceae bacterium]|nr:T9SS type A sorting domain-containing protein [Ignavibacteriaceae bacterium]